MPTLTTVGTMDPPDAGEAARDCTRVHILGSRSASRGRDPCAFSVGPPNRLVQEVDASDPMAPRGEEQGGVTRAAAGVEDRIGDLVGDRDERLLRLADVPRRLPGVKVLKGRTVGHITHEGILLPRACIL